MSEPVFDREARSLMQTYGRHRITLVHGEGVWVYDEEERRYLDCLSGLGVTSVGHANARVSAAVAEQMSRLVHVSNLYYTRPQVELAERLTALGGMDRVFFANDGATANECAIKLARRWAQRTRGRDAYEIVTLDGSFHGRTLATLAATGQPKKQAVFEPLPPGFRQVPAGDIESLGDVVGAATAAVMVETIQGEGGVVPLDAGYLREVRRLTSDRGVLLIVDDVQAGIGRTGTWFSWQSLGFEPDVATSAKALANGLPVGVCLAQGSAAQAFERGDHATTFGGGPVICRAALAVLDEIEQRGVLRNVAERSAQLQRGLEAIDGVAEVRGRGLLVAAVLTSDRAKEVTEEALRRGLLVNDVRPDTVRFAPPLIIDEEQTEDAVLRFREAVRSTPA